LAHEGRTGCTILFGGFDDTETQLGDTWAWSGFGWERLDIDGPPAGGVYAIPNDAVGVILHGGGRKAEGTAWCLEDRTWLHRDVASPRRPAGGAGFGLVM
jgi:hypothetical protein